MLVAHIRIGQKKGVHPTGGLSRCATEISQERLAGDMSSYTPENRKLAGAWHGKVRLW